MTWKVQLWGIFLVFVQCHTMRTSSESESTEIRRILIISLDGFGHDYLTKYPWQYLNKIYARGSYPEKFRNQFVTKTFPNHFSVATGVYEEVHGIVGNNVYDRQLNANLKITDEGFFTQNPNIAPIWTLNEENNGHSGCIMWPGCGVEYRNRNVTFWEPYKKGVELTDSIDKVLQWLTHAETPANLIFLYHEQPDNVGHAYGPNSTYVVEELRKIDESLGYLLRTLILHELHEVVDLIIMSDHGMMMIPDENIIYLDEIVDSKLYHISGTSPVLNIWPTGDVLTLYKALLKGSSTHRYTVYLKDELPLMWHFRNNARISSITLIADEGYVFQDFHRIIEFYKKEGFPDLTDKHGDHGYFVNVSSMEPIFVATGPSFKRGYEAPPFSNIDVYPLLCHMLSLSPGPHNGTLDKISSIMFQPLSAVLVQPLLIALGCLVGLMALIGLAACVTARRDSQPMVTADLLINGYIHRKTMRTGPSTEEDASEEECLLEGETYPM